MAYFHRLILALIFLLPFGAIASYPQIDGYQYPNTSVNPAIYNSMSAACNWYVSYLQSFEGPEGWTYVYNRVANTTCYFHREAGSTVQGENSQFFQAIQHCPENTTFNGTTCDATCVAPSVYDAETSTCIAPVKQCDPEGSNLSKGWAVEVSQRDSDSRTTCQDGCGYDLLPNSVGVGVKNAAGQWQFSEQLGASYGACVMPVGETSQPATQESTPAQKCKQQGKSYGTVNGVTVCVGTGTAGAPDVKTKDSTKTTTKPNETVSTTTNNIINNNGSVTTTTTTTTTNTSTGAQTTETKTEEQPKQSFCEENPTATICKEGSFSGSCAGSFTCEGDAIQCSIAKEQHIRNCTLYDNKTALSDKGQAMIDGTDSTQNPADTANRETVDLDSMVSEGSNIGGGSFQDKHISMPHGGGFDLPFSKLNFIMNILGGVLLAGAYLNAARIVGVR